MGLEATNLTRKVQTCMVTCAYLSLARITFSQHIMLYINDYILFRPTDRSLRHPSVPPRHMNTSRHGWGGPTPECLFLAPSPFISLRVVGGNWNGRKSRESCSDRGLGERQQRDCSHRRHRFRPICCHQVDQPLARKNLIKPRLKGSQSKPGGKLPAPGQIWQPTSCHIMK